MSSARRKTGWVCHENFYWHDTGNWAGMLPPGPGIQPLGGIGGGAILRRVESLLRINGILDRLEPLEFSPASDEQLCLVHHIEHVIHIEACSIAGYSEAGIFAPIGFHSALSGRLAVGGVIRAVEAAMKSNPATSYSLVCPPGHHAESDKAMAFCLYNNVAIGARAALKCGAKRVLIVDWDAHHGNGIEKTFYENSEVLYISVHQEGLFPPQSGNILDLGAGEGTGFNINIPLPPGSGHGAYLETMRQIIVPAGEAYHPDIIIVACGLDASAFDPLGRQLCSSRTYSEMTAELLSLALRVCEGRLVLVQEGGYSEWYLPFLVQAIVAELAGLPKMPDPYLYSIEEMPGQVLQPHQRQRIEQVLAAHSRFGLIS